MLSSQWMLGQRFEYRREPRRKMALGMDGVSRHPLPFSASLLRFLLSLHPLISFA